MDEKTILLFDNYLQGVLSLQEQRDLEARIAKEPELADAFTIFKEVNGHLSHTFSQERSDFKNTIERSANAYFEDANSPRGTISGNSPSKVIALKPWRYLVAASVVLFFGVMLWMNFQSASYADYAFDGTISLTERSGGELAFAKAEKAFNSQSYEEAILFFDTILSNDPENAEVAYYKGIALVELGKHAEAESLFEQLAQGGSVYKYKALWYNGLSHLKRKDIEGAKTILNKIPSDAEDYEKAQELLDKL
ncbi:hypothetical protein EAX61_13325 [Dokdonia sinensis]|uniref:Uncharacterized protein n=1 Tax=Dokdonia sinensis TaxID=2479847 RepID=A0A3M0FXX3_9FLAO|nr:tetratricopeptide repeat protein [Dokdonia sinensis]RMB56777.1 hypothetical protein EAX61_13325 [Dokdonia sinensis]